MISIYKIHNTSNNKVYVGQSIHIEQRFIEHRNALKYNRHCNLHLQSAWNKYGSASLVFEVLEECPQSELNARETFWKLHFDPNTYNLGHTNFEGTTSEETRQKLSVRFKGDNNPAKRADVRKRISDAQRGHEVPQEVRKKISKTLTGRSLPPRSQKHIEALRAASPNKKSVKQFTKDGELVKIWDCVSDAARALNVSQANISDCCKGCQKSAKGFIWKY